MNELNFGEQLRIFRGQCRHPQTGRPITQIQFAEFLYVETKLLYTGAAISDWENNKSKIDPSYRSVLVGIIKVLRKYGGITKLEKANQFLEAGNHRDLTSLEQEDLFPEAIFAANSQNTNKKQIRNSWLNSFFVYLFFNSPEEFKNEWESAKEGPLPAWPRLAVAIIRKQTESLTPIHFWNLILWAWILVGGYWLIVPSFQLPFDTQQNAYAAMKLYIIGTFALPFLISLMVNTRDNLFWKEQNLQKSFILRLYVVQGSYVGFHVAYFFIFFITFLTTHFQIQQEIWVEILKILCITAFSYASTHLVPYNLWRAYQRLDLKDGWMFFIFIVVGPAWAWFFLEFYEILTSPTDGIISILIAITLIIMIKIYKNRKNNEKIKNTR